MIQKRLLLSALFIVMTLSACYSTLTVRVHSFDMEKMRNAAEYQNKVRKAEYSYYQGLIQNHYFDTIRHQFNIVSWNALEKLYSNNKISRDVEDSVYETVGAKYYHVIASLKLATEKVSDILEILVKSKSDSLEKRYSAARYNFEIAKRNILSFAQNLGTELGTTDFNIKLDRHALNRTIATITQSNSYGVSIASDDMASFVVKAPEDYWRKYTDTFYTNSNNLRKSKKNASMNITRVTTFIGNSDIAIKMDGPGNFIVKGVRLDADQAFRTSFKVLSQGIKYLTYTSGLPNNSTTSTASSTANDIPSVPELKDFTKNKNQASSLNTQYQQLTDTYLKILDNYKIDLVSKNDDKRKAAVLAIKNAYMYYKSQLPLQ